MWSKGEEEDRFRLRDQEEWLRDQLHTLHTQNNTQEEGFWDQLHTLHTQTTLHRPRRDIHHPNLAMSMTLSFAIAMNYSNCWLCQHIPHSATSAMWISIPLTREELAYYNWQNMTWDRDCYSDPRESTIQFDPTQSIPKAASLSLKPAVSTTANKGQLVPSLEVVSAVSSAVNKEHLPIGWNMTEIFRLVAFEKIGEELVKGEVVFQAETTHAQTNCSTGSSNCKITGLGNRLKCYSELIYREAEYHVSYSELIYREAEYQVRFLQCDIHLCQGDSNDYELRPSSERQTLIVVPVYNVSNCFTGIQGENKLGVFVGNSSCKPDTLIQTNLNSPANLPKGIYAVCGEKAYTLLPPNSQGRCYLAHIVPMIRKVNGTEIQASYSEHKRKTSRKKRTLSWWQKVLGVIIPNYGVYNTQKELEALSTVLEKHMNVSDAAIGALATEMSEIRAITLQNRMALDIMLANKGGTCAIIKTECCSFVSDPTTAIAKLHEDTQAGVQELHKNHGGVFWGTFEGWFSGIGNTLTRTLILIVITVVVLLLVFVCISACIKAVMSRVMGSEVVVQPQTSRQIWIPPFHDSNIV